MFVEGGWRRPEDEPPFRRPRLTDRQQRLVVWLILLNALLLLFAPIGGATIIHAAIAFLKHS